MNIQDIENAKRIMKILKGHGPSYSQGIEYSHLRRIRYRDSCISISFGDCNGFAEFRLLNGEIYVVKGQKFITVDNVESFIISNCLSQPKPTERLNELSTLFFNAIPLGFDTRAILVMDGTFPEVNRCRFTLRLYYVDSNGVINKTWDYDKTPEYDLQHLTRNIDSYIRSIEISNIKNCIEDF